MQNKIKFWGRTKPDYRYWAFSNFYPSPIFVCGKWWRTSEHLYQALKFEDDETQEKIRNCNSPKDAANIGRTAPKIRKDWEEVKDDMMFVVLNYKFMQHKHLQELLLNTGDAEIIEDSPYDYYWGIGADGTGKNVLGKLLMELRTIIRRDTIGKDNTKSGT